jgi:amino acid permease
MSSPTPAPPRIAVVASTGLATVFAVATLVTAMTADLASRFDLLVVAAGTAGSTVWFVVALTHWVRRRAAVRVLRDRAGAER